MKKNTFDGGNGGEAKAATAVEKQRRRLRCIDGEDEAVVAMKIRLGFGDRLGFWFKLLGRVFRYWVSFGCKKSV